MGLLDTILNIVFPVNCVSCGKNGENLCSACLSSAPPADRESAEWVFPLFDYRHPPIKKSIWLLKYKGRKTLAKVFAEVLYGHILQELADLKIMQNFDEALLIPIPVDKRRLRERGFNQAEIICRELDRLDQNTNFKMKNNILIKIKDTGHQARIENKGERLKNILGSFALEDEKRSAGEIKGKNIILLDDVTTTGATLDEARKVLRQAGARKVIAFTIAH